MEQLVYISRAADHIDSGEVFQIVRDSAQRNPERGLTGFLVFVRGLFIQYVEGESDALDGLLDALARDDRHSDLHVIDRRPIASRRFPAWRMERVSMAERRDTALEQMLRSAGMSDRAIIDIHDRLNARRAA